MNAAPVVNAGNDVTIDEGSIFFREGSFTDPGADTWSATVNYGDGPDDQILVLDPAKTFTLNHVYADNGSYTVTVCVSDDDGAEGCDYLTVTVENVAPTATANGNVIDENDQATVSGTITDPGIQDSFTVMIDWGEGTPETFAYPAGTTSYNKQHQYLDDNPTGTSSDVYKIDVTVTDDDRGVGVADTTVRVNNVNPVASIDSITDETGQLIEYGVRSVLVGLTLDVVGSFTDVGSQDTQVARIDWGDGAIDELGSTTGAAAAAHIYALPGEYTMVLIITDDDIGVGAAETTIKIVDPAEALEEAIDDLSAFSDNPGVAAAIDKLYGESDGQASNGAIDLLEKGDLNAALGMIQQALQYLEAAQEADPSLDLANVKDFLALTAKSVAVEAIAQAEAEATKQNEWRKIAQAHDILAQGNALLAAWDYVGAVGKYQEAVREVQGIHIGGVFPAKIWTVFLQLIMR